jgi:AAA ATPase domain
MAVETGAMFVGRDDELAGLLHRVSRPTVTLVVGEAGIGKSRLLQETVRRVDHPVLIGRSWQGSTATPFFSWLQIMSRATDHLAPEAIGSSTRHDLDPLLSSGRIDPRFEDSETSKHLLALALTEYLARLCQECAGLVTLVLEDLHAADPQSIELATWVARQRLPLSMVATSRPFAEADSEISAALGRFHAEADLLALGPLGDVAIERLITEASLPAAAVADAREATRGVPLLLREWVATRAISGSRSVRTSPVARFETLGADVRELVALAALTGDEFDLAVVGDAAGLEPSSALAAIDAAVAAGVLDRVGASATRFRFHHEEIRHGIEIAIGTTERADGHRRLLEVLVAKHGLGADSDLSRLAHHGAQAAFVGDADLAVELSLMAGDRALKNSAPSSAVQHYGQAIELAEFAGAPIEDRLRAEIGLGRATRAAGGGDATRTILGVLTRTQNDPKLIDQFVEAALLLPANWCGLALSPEGEVQPSFWLRRALDALGPEVSERRLRLLVELGLQSRASDEKDLFAGLFGEANEIAAALDDPKLSAYVFAAEVWMRPRPGVLGETLEEIARLEAQTLGDADSQLVLRALRVTTLLRAGRFAIATKEMDRMEAALAPVPPFVSWILGRWRAMLLLGRGEVDAAEREGTRAFEQVQGTEVEACAFEFLTMQIAVATRERIGLDRILPVFSDIQASRPHFSAYRAAYAWMLSDLGRTDEARRELVGIFHRGLHDNADALEWLPLVSMAGTAAAELGEADWCREAVEALEPYRDEWIVWGTGIVVDGPVRLRRAHMALASGLVDIARDDLRVARAQIFEAGTKLFVPVLLHHEAELAAVGGDRAAAVDLMTRASTASADIGLDAAAGVLAARAFELALNGRETVDPPARDTTSVGRADPTRGCSGLLQRQGATWVVGLDGETAAVGHVKGLLVLAFLLEQPGREFHVVELAAALDGNTRGRSDPELLGGDAGGGALLDDAAIGAYRARVVSLQEDLDEARSFNDIHRAESAREELDFIVDELRRSTGLAGRSRRQTGDAERARVRVTKSLRTAISRIYGVDRRLGAHLNGTVSTGAYCVYRPEGLQHIDWRVDTGS